MHTVILAHTQTPAPALCATLLPACRTHASMFAMLGSKGPRASSIAPGLFVRMHVTRPPLPSPPIPSQSQELHRRDPQAQGGRTAAVLPRGVRRAESAALQAALTLPGSPTAALPLPRAGKRVGNTGPAAAALQLQPQARESEAPTDAEAGVGA
eukprot:357744-Chlamydomonas_euryale.AAC.5